MRQKISEIIWQAVGELNREQRMGNNTPEMGVAIQALEAAAWQAEKSGN